MFDSMFEALPAIQMSLNMGMLFQGIHDFERQTILGSHCFVAYGKMSPFTHKSAPQIPKIEGGEVGSANSGHAHI